MARSFRTADMRYWMILCQYRKLEWRIVDTLVREGNSMSIQWPAPETRGDIREAGRSASYACILRADDEEYTYQVVNEEALGACQPGSRWRMEMMASAEFPAPSLSPDCLSIVGEVTKLPKLKRATMGLVPKGTVTGTERR